MTQTIACPNKTFKSQGFNARFSAGWNDEDAMGLLKRMARKADARQFSKGVLKLTGFRLLALKFRIQRLNCEAKARFQWSGDGWKMLGHPIERSGLS